VGGWILKIHSGCAIQELKEDEVEKRMRILLGQRKLVAERKNQSRRGP
jgi:hydrogenase maturation factor